MRTTIHHVTALALAGAHLAAAPTARAAGENQATAAALFEQGKQLMAAGDFANACPKIAEAARLVPTAAKMNRLGDCREHEGKLASAWGAFKQAELMARNADDGEREAEAMRRAGLLALRLAKLTIVVSPGARVPGLTVRRDDDDVGEGQWGSSLPIDTGAHPLSAGAPGYRTWSTVVRIETDGSSASVEIPALVRLPPESTADSAWGPQRIAGLAVGGTGVLGLAVGTAFGIVTLNKTNAAKAHCSATLPECDSIGVGLENSAKTTANVSDVGLALGGAALVGGVVLFLTASANGPKMSGSLRLAPLLGQGQAGLTAEGRW